MSSGRSAACLRETRALFEVGVASGLSDAELLERFLLREGDAAELAFGAILARHGPMVLGICQRILANPHDAEDAFQATFLVLVRRAASIRVEDSLAYWLYGVSSRIAVRAKTYGFRRKTRQIHELGDVPAAMEFDLHLRELAAVLDEELGRIPARYRQPVVLCDLGGLSQEEAARQLACPVGTIKSRLSRGRQHLRERLARRGLAPERLPLAVAFLSRTPPIALRDASVRAALGLKAGGGVFASSLTTSVRSMLWKEELGMIVSKLKGLTAGLVVGTCIAVGVGVRGQETAPRAERQGRVPGEQVLAEATNQLDNAELATVLVAQLLAEVSKEGPASVEIKALPERRIAIAVRGTGASRSWMILEPMPGERLRMRTRNEDGTESLLECSGLRMNLSAPTIEVMSDGKLETVHVGRSPAEAPATGDTESRLRAVERKLDRLLEALEKPRIDSRFPPKH